MCFNQILAVDLRHLQPAQKYKEIISSLCRAKVPSIEVSVWLLS